MDESQIKQLYASSNLSHDPTAKLVYSYLIHNCYSNTAESFGSALRIQPNQDIEMTDNSSGLGSRGARWSRVNKIKTSFIPPF
jgi:hypothetical protein